MAMTDDTTPASDNRRAGHPDFGALVTSFAKVGLLSFGGAAGQIAMMHRMVVDEKGWIDEEDYLGGLNFCMMLPGPEAQQLATYIGWRLHGVAGGLAAGLLFVIPGALVMLGLSFLYVLGSGVPMVEGILFGIKAAVLAIIVQAVIKIARRGLKTRWLYALAGVSFLAMMFVRVPFPVIVLAAGLIGAVFASSGTLTPATEEAIPRARWRISLSIGLPCLVIWWAPVALAAFWLGSTHFLVEIGLFFSKLAVVTFGGAYAVLAYVSDEAVRRNWVDLRQMMDGLGLAETTPGPTILVNQFVAFLAGWKQPNGIIMAVAAAGMAVWTTFAPSFLWIFAGAPYLDDLKRRPVFAGALRGISAAVVGAIASVGVTFALVYCFGRTERIETEFFKGLVPDGTSLDIRALGLVMLGLGLTFLRGWSIVQLVLVLAMLGLALSQLQLI